MVLSGVQRTDVVSRRAHSSHWKVLHKGTITEGLAGNAKAPSI